MSNSLFKGLTVNINSGRDVFVGIQRKNEDYEVNFPLGYRLGEGKKGLREDILLLINVLAKNTDKKESELYIGPKADSTGIPVQAYLYLIQDFFARGYYKEREIYRQIAKRGKIDWGRTIKTQKPLIQENEAYYLDFVVKKNTINEDELITLVHKYCVYESFEKFGWLFTSFVPSKPQTVLESQMMLAAVNDKLQNVFNDRNRQLFKNMIAVIKAKKDDGESDFRYGTDRFEYVWEKMIDRLFGTPDKKEYFPGTKWKLTSGKEYSNSTLKPDSIMKLNGKVYVIDAKYYQFGCSDNLGHLPESASIHKQITYGEYIAKFEHPTVYNAFIMPYDSLGSETYHCIGYAEGDWKCDKNEYENVLGILMDVKHLMSIDGRTDLSEQKKLAKFIDDSYKEIVK